jgi:hypothetical protein
MNKDIGFRLGVAAAFVLVCCMGTTHAVERNWTGSDDADWHNVRNWAPEGVPGLGDIVTVPSSPAGGQFPFIVNADAFCQGLIIQTDAQVSVGVDVRLYIVTPPPSDFDGDSGDNLVGCLHRSIPQPDRLASRTP